ncbi:MAG: 2-polyprenyl-3-methyl-6-methoxy-1,4-benzoquinone monooxygenase [Gammaproteobacteria bacterium]
MVTEQRHYTFADRIIMAIEYSLHEAHKKPTAQRKNPMAPFAHEPDKHTEKERQHVAALMRINHAGEIAAQGLYHGQATTAKTIHIQETMEKAAKEEVDHLNWCHERLTTLHNKPSLFSTFWYLGSFTLGAIAGALGDRWNLGFVAETERQVAKHIDAHLAQLPHHDKKTRAILEAMRIDELQHASHAEEAGGLSLPFPLPWLMSKVALVMKKTAYYF